MRVSRHILEVPNISIILLIISLFVLDKYYMDFTFTQQKYLIAFLPIHVTY